MFVKDKQHLHGYNRSKATRNCAFRIAHFTLCGEPSKPCTVSGAIAHSALRIAHFTFRIAHYLYCIVQSHKKSKHGFNRAYSLSKKYFQQAVRLLRMLQDALFFAPKLYIGTARGQKKSKTMPKASVFDVRTLLKSDLFFYYFCIVVLVTLSTV